MLNTVEQKLSAIKAISEAKDANEELLSTTSYIDGIVSPTDTLDLTISGKFADSDSFKLEKLPGDLVKKILSLIKSHAELEKTLLIQQAAKLINSASE
jgi:hypothetical protein